MNALVVALALAPAAAFVGPAPAAPSTVMKESLGDLKALQKSLPGPPNDYFDPLNLATMTFDWGPQGEEATIGWLRHAAGAVGQHPAHRQAPDPHRHRHARVVRRGRR